MMSGTVVFQPHGRSTEVEAGETLLEAARRAGVEIESTCGGELRCGRCRVVVLEGSEHLSPAEGEELELLRDAMDMRLACSARVQGGRVVVLVPEESRPEHTSRKELSPRRVEVEPAVRAVRVEVSPASLSDQRDDWSRVEEALRSLGIQAVPELEALRGLSDELRRGGWKLTLFLWGDRVIGAEAGEVAPLGVAVDFGTTTIAGYLVELTTGEVLAASSILNPQVRFGEDVLSRVSHAMGGDAQAKELAECAVLALGELVGELCEKAGRKPEHVGEMVVVGNTAMHHLLLNLPVAQLALSPYVPAVARGLAIRADELGVSGLPPASRVYLPPVQAGFVGSDCTSVLVALEPELGDGVQLIVDIGTNGEIVLGSRHRLLSASCATGPAFEGAQITHGMRAVKGAIEGVRIDPETLEPRLRVIGGVVPKGICGSGIIEAVAEMLRAGILTPSGAFSREAEERSPRVRRGRDGYEYVLASGGDTHVAVTQKDVRAIQLAKAALYTGCKLLMRRYPVERVDRIILAGAFGSYISREAALMIGMLPECHPERVVQAGNAAGDGARIMLVNRSSRELAERLAREVEYVELTAEEGFQEEFMNAMHFPHAVDELPTAKRLLGWD